MILQTESKFQLKALLENKAFNVSKTLTLFIIGMMI